MIRVNIEFTANNEFHLSGSFKRKTVFVFGIPIYVRYECIAPRNIKVLKSANIAPKEEKIRMLDSAAIAPKEEKQ